MIGTSLNQYQITASIGAGGMGEVFRARDTRLNRDGVERTPAGMDDVACYPNLTVELLRRGYAEKDIKKILGENFLRVLSQAERFARKSQASNRNR